MADKDNKASPGTLQLTGAAGDAQKKTRSVPAYRDYQIKKAEAGEKPVSLEDWMSGKR